MVRLLRTTAARPRDKSAGRVAKHILDRAQLTIGMQR